MPRGNKPKDILDKYNFLYKDYEKARKDLESIKENQLKGLDLDQFIFNKFSTRLDPVFYIENVLRAHLPESRRHLHENQIELVRAVCNSKIRKVAAIMARQCFIKNTKILMADGLIKNVQDILLGDKVITPDNKVSTVISITMGKAKVYKIVPSDNPYQSYTVTGNHKLALIQDNKKITMTVEEFIKQYGYKSSNIYGYRSLITLPINGTLEERLTLYKELVDESNKQDNSFIIPYNEYYMTILNSLCCNPYEKDNKIYFGQLSQLTYSFTIKEMGEEKYYGFTIDDPNHLFILASGIVTSNSGKCFAPGTEILMADRTIKKVEDIEIDDYIMRPNGLPARVLNLGHGQEEMFMVKPNDSGKPFIVNKSHILSLMHIINQDIKNISVKNLINNKENNAFYWGYRMSPDFKEKIPFTFDLIPQGIGNYYGFTIDTEDHLFLLSDYTVTHNTESIASFCGYLIDNYPNMRIGIFTPRIQQAEVTIGRLSIFIQMNEEKLNNRLVKCTKSRIELSNNSFVSAVSASDQSNIEGLTFDIAVLDEAQKVSNYTFSERILPMCGSCGISTTIISLGDGSYKTIDEIVSNEEKVDIISYDETDKKIKTATIIGYKDMGIKDTIKITLESGLTFEATKDHKVLTWIRQDYPRHSEWIEFKDIKVGNRIGVPRIEPFFGVYYEKDAYLLGLLIGDGSYNKNITFRNYSDTLWDYILNNYNDNTIPKWRKDFITTSGKHYREASLQQVKPILQKAGIYGQASLNKQLPNNWSKWDKESLQNLIAGLFDTDGNIFYPSDIKKQRPRLSFANICESIIKDMQIILLKFGIRTHIQYRKAKSHEYNGKVIKGGKFYVLNILGKENIETFANNIPIKEEDKVSNLKKIMQYFQDHKYKIDKSLLNTDLRFEKVVKLEYGSGHVYDLLIEPYHTYMANHIISHNCNGKVVQIGTPKARNHFYDAIEGKESSDWFVVRRDWTECPQLAALAATTLPDHTDPEHKRMRDYSTFVLSLMPKSLKQEYFPTRPDIWKEGSMSVEDFKTQYMLQFVDGSSQFLTAEEIRQLSDGEFDWLETGVYGEQYFAGIDFAGSAADTADSTHISIIRLDPATNQKQKIFALELTGMSYPEQINVIDDLLGGRNPRFNCQAIFADFTGCGRPVVQTLIEERGIRQITGITFNATDTFTHTGMNLKNAMYSYTKQEIDNNRFKYPTADNFIKVAGKDNVGFWYKQIGQWSDLLCEQRTANSVNKSIHNAPGSHDDAPSADILGVYAAIVAKQRPSGMPRPVTARLFR